MRNLFVCHTSLLKPQLIMVVVIVHPIYPEIILIICHLYEMLKSHLTVSGLENVSFDPSMDHGDTSTVVAY